MLTPHATDILFTTLYNSSPRTIFLAVYGEGHDVRYIEEKCLLIRRTPSLWWGLLDKEHRARFVDYCNDCLGVWIIGGIHVVGSKSSVAARVAEHVADRVSNPEDIASILASGRFERI